MGAGAVESLVDRLVAANRAAAVAQARVLGLVLKVVNAAPDPRYGVDEVAFALSWTKRAAAAQEGLARQLVDGLPEVFAALADGYIDVPKARVFADVLENLDPVVAQQVAAQVLPVAPEKTTTQLRDRLHRRALAADPEHARKRRERARTERRVVLQPAADGTASLSALGLCPARAAAAFARIARIAKARKASGAPETMDQLRADVLLDLLEGVDAPAGRGVIDLTVGLETLAGLDENPALLAGFGPVGADIARQWVHDNPGYQWRAQIIDPDTGELLWQGLTRARPCPPAQDPQARFANAAMARWIRARDKTCRGPGVPGPRQTMRPRPHHQIRRRRPDHPRRPRRAVRAAPPDER
ncbi:hypothetical protein Rhe02_10030 [Rhizocola hellebori]|uniref:DUF222 domain-containing protein n=1 Tax=Rhizocola hellebori TaxID=1392758 RepID=A0A8J3VE21_9ACTN|nr:HNH endonuclease [Rhizocola hellebori]GIH02936.1 hypothetical protein Rhe02_10030 [Rhizocola hellebori]